jgi:hypothetical protein
VHLEDVEILRSAGDDGTGAAGSFNRRIKHGVHSWVKHNKIRLAFYLTPATP